MTTLIPKYDQGAASLASNGYVKLTWYRYGWVVTGYGTWTGTTP